MSRAATNTLTEPVRVVPNRLLKVLSWLVVSLVLLLIAAWVAYELTPQQRAVRSDRRAFSAISIPSNWKIIPGLSGEDDSNFFAGMFKSQGAGYTYQYQVSGSTAPETSKQATKILQSAGYKITSSGDAIPAPDYLYVRGYNAAKDITLSVSIMADQISFDVTKGQF